MRPVSDVLGNFPVKLDDKSRIVLPAKLRGELAACAYLGPGPDSCIFLLSKIQLDQHLKRIADQPAGSKRSGAYNRMFKGNLVWHVPDKQGRIPIKSPLKEYAGLEREVVVLGLGDRQEIWDVARWRAYQDANMEQYVQSIDML